MKISRAAFSVLVKFSGLYEAVREVLQKIEEFILIDNSKEQGQERMKAITAEI